MMDYDDDSKDDNPFRNYSIPVYIYAASIGVVIIGQIVQASMGSWYRKVEAEKLALERQRIAEIQAEAHRSLYLPTDRVRIGRGFKNIDPVYPFAWIAIVLAVVATYRLNQELSEHKCIQSKDELGVAINCPGGEWWDKFALKFTCITTFTLGVHAVLMPVVMVLKYFDFRPSDYSSCLRSSARKQVDESGLAWSVLSVHMNCCMKIYFFLLGGVLGLVNKILQLIAMYLCVDLRILYFPSPFVEFSESRARIESMRIGKRTVKFDADFGEVYLRHCMDKLLSFLTLTLSDKCGAEERYHKWLDSKMRFVGLPPANGANVFKFHAARPSCGARLNACYCACCCPIVGGCIAEHILTSATISDMNLGGLKVTLGMGDCDW